MTPPTHRPSTIYIEIDVSGLSLIDAERYYNFLKATGMPMPVGCEGIIRIEVEEVEE